MKGKYITLQIRMACIKKPVGKQYLYEDVEKTIREHQRIMRQIKKPGSLNVRLHRQVPV